MPASPNSTHIFPQLLLRYRPWCIAGFQAWLVLCSLLLAWWLQFDFSLPYRTILFAAAPMLVAIRIATLTYFGLLRGWWKYAGVRDGLNILKAVASGSVIFWVILQPVLHLSAFPRSIYLLEAFLTTSLLVGVRLLCRIFAESVRESISSGKRVMVIGAGSAAQTILREIGRADSGYAAVGCLDDNESKHGVRIHDVPVLGTVDQLPEVLKSEPAEEVLIAVPSATSAQMRRFIEICNHAKVKCRTVPALKDIIAGQVTMSQLREVSLEDLLGREPVQLDLDSVRREIEGGVVLVTGAAGSIGSELCRQILDYNPERLVCLDQNETGLFFLEHDLRSHANTAQLAFCVADVCDSDCLANFLSECKPQIIFHAAAYKHVPMMESNAQEAIRNNVLSFPALLDLAEEAGCGSFVLISSDKAVNPTNIMGATKRVCELIVASRPANGMRCVSVRFGNVLGSSGSVVQVLQKQLEKKQALTITHQDIKRFFMIVSEAVTLVLQAFVIGSHGDILVLDMGEPIRIVDLARTLIRLSGRPEDEVEICFIGLREGEKMNEELFYGNEKVLPTPCEKIKRTNGAKRDWAELRAQLDELYKITSEGGADRLRAMIQEIVPEYEPLNGFARHTETEESIGSFRKAAGQV
jgi:FlaA1/EpsC-like NDP-sugar epimerase